MTVWSHIKTHIPKLVVAGVFLLAIFIFVHNSPHLSRQRPVYTSDQLSKAATDYRYSLNTYDGSATLINHYTLRGLELHSTHIGGVYNGYKALHDALDFTSSGGFASIYDTPAVAYDYRLHNYKATGFKRYKEPILPSILKDKSNRHYPVPNTLLVIKTLSTQKIIAVFGGGSVKEYYSDINNVDIYKVDSYFVVTYDCSYAIVDYLALQ